MLESRVNVITATYDITQSDYASVSMETITNHGEESVCRRCGRHILLGQKYRYEDVTKVLAHVPHGWPKTVAVHDHCPGSYAEAAKAMQVDLDFRKAHGLWPFTRKHLTRDTSPLRGA